MILCVYEFDPGPGTAVKYMISYNDGATWFFGWIAQPTASELYIRPDVALRQGGGMSVIWQEEVGEPDIMWYRRRDYPQDSAWSSPEQFNEQDVVTGSFTEIEVLPPPPGFGRAYGVSWITSAGIPLNTLFDRNDEVPGPLTADRTKIFAAAGQKVLLNLNAGSKNAGRNYLMLGSVSGTVPGTPLPGGFVTLPLNWDIFTSLVIDLLNTAVFNNFSGNLNAAGQAQAVFNTLGPQPGAVGLTVYFAFALGGPWDYASNAVALPFVN